MFWGTYEKYRYERHLSVCKHYWICQWFVEESCLKYKTYARTNILWKSCQKKKKTFALQELNKFPKRA